MLLDRSTFFIKEHVAILKWHDEFDIIDPETGEKIGHAVDEPGALKKILRLFISKNLLGTTVRVRDLETGQIAFSIKRGGFLFRAKIEILGPEGDVVGRMKSKLFSLGGGFHVLDDAGNKIADVKGDIIGWDFRFLSADGVELGRVTKKWAGIGRELFTSADQYVVTLDEAVSDNPALKMVLLATAISVDMVYKERNQ